MEVIINYQPINKENNSEWDLISKKEKILVELTSIFEAGSQTTKIQKKYNIKNPKIIWDHDEVFKEAKKVIERKINKKSDKNDYFHKILIIISAFNSNKKNPIFYTLSRKSEWQNIDKFHQILVNFSKNKLNFKNGEIIFSYGVMQNINRIYKVKNNFIDLEYREITNNNFLLIGKIHKSGFSEQQWSDYLKRISPYKNYK